MGFSISILKCYTIIPSIKVLLVPVTSIDKESLYSRVPEFFRKGIHLYCTRRTYSVSSVLKVVGNHHQIEGTRPWLKLPPKLRCSR